MLARTRGACAGCSGARRSRSSCWPHDRVNGLLIARSRRASSRRRTRARSPARCAGRRTRRSRRWTRSMRQIAGVVQSDPAVDNVISFTGGAGATNTGAVYVALKPLSERKIGAAAVIDRLRPRARARAVGRGLPAGGAGPALRRAREQRDVPVHDPERRRRGALRSGARSSRRCSALPGFQDVSSDQQNGGLPSSSTTTARGRRALGPPCRRSTPRSTTRSDKRRCRSSIRR